jgi:hypothetical protein
LTVRTKESALDKIAVRIIAKCPSSRPQKLKGDQLALGPKKGNPSVLKRLRDDGWYFVCQVKKNRLFAGKPLRDYKRQPYWQAVGKLSGGIKVRVVKYRRQYYVTNRLSLPAQELRATYKRRPAIEEVFRFLTDQLSLAACQAGYTRLGNEKSPVEEGVQAQHMALCLIADLILERERINQGVTLRHLRHTLIVRGLKVSLPSLKHVRMAA